MWKDGKKWVYSITYDEGCQDLLENALPVHRRYGVPGHVALLAGQIGVLRDVSGSSYHGMMILSRAEIEELGKEGWGVSNHGMTHAGIYEENAEFEVVESRRVIEEALERPVPIFCVPNNNDSYPASKAVAGKAEYTAIMTLYDQVNCFDTDLYRLGRVALHTEYPPPFYSVFDPYKRLHQAIDLGGWVIDYCHCPMPGKAIHPWKDCTTEELDERFETVCRIGGDDVWLADPNEVVEYILETRAG